MRNRFALFTSALFLVCAGTSWSQSEDATGILNRLFQEKKSELKPSDAEQLNQAAEEAKQMLESQGGQESIVKQAEEVLTQDPDTLEQLFNKLMEDPELLESGEKLMDEQGVSSDTMEQAREYMGNKAFMDMIKAKFSQAQKEGTLAQDIEALTGTMKPKPPEHGVTAKLEVTPGVIPKPADPIKIPIPRPNLGGGQKTTIEAEEAYFNTDRNEVMFQGNVVLSHPQFDMSCDILEVLLKGDGNKGGAMPGQMAADGIERAIAKGYVQIEKMAPDGKVQVAKSRLAVYNSMSQELVLSDYPSLQRGKDLIVGLSETTKIHLRADGSHRVDGPSKVIVDQGKSLQFKPRP